MNEGTLNSPTLINSSANMNDGTINSSAPINSSITTNEGNLNSSATMNEENYKIEVGLSTKRIVYIETNVLEEDRVKGGLNVMTGQLGNVVKESAMIAHTFARRFLQRNNLRTGSLRNSKLHLHGLTGVIGYDGQTGASGIEGPSAGCTVITSYLSLAMNKLVRKDLAMTGAISLTGRILPIGGVMEKTLAARRSQIKTIIFPAGNWINFDELPQNVKEGLDVHFVDEYEQIFELAFNYD